MCQSCVLLRLCQLTARSATLVHAQVLMARIKRDNASVEQMTAEAKQLQTRIKQLEARQGAAASTAAAAGGGGVVDDPAKW